MKNINGSIHGKGYPLVFFHGWGFDSQIWHGLIAQLGSNYTLYLIDLPGFGKTPLMSWASFKSSLLACLPEHFALIGWSLGGLLATQLALEEPLRVTHLINVATSPKFIKAKDWPGLDKRVVATFYHHLRQEPQKTLSQFIQLQLSGHSEGLIKTDAPAPQGLKSGLDILSDYDLRQDIRALTMPVCYLFGRLDAIIPKRTHACMQQMYPSFHYVLLPKAAHAPFLSHPDEFIVTLKEFLW